MGKAYKTNIFLLAIFLSIAFVGAFIYKPMSPDSWTLFDISEWFLKDSPLTSIRQFRVDTSLTLSSPFLYPLVLSVINFFFNVGHSSGLVANLVFLIAAPFVFYKAILQINGCSKNSLYLVLALFLSIYGNWYFVIDFIEARALPLTLFLYGCFFAVYLDGKVGRLRDIKLGILLGLLLASRFDTLPFVVIMLTSTLFLEDENGNGLQRFKALVIRTAIAGAFTVPYILYIYSGTGSLFLTESNGIIFFAQAIHPTTFLFDNPSTVFEAPWVWFNRVFVNLLSAIPSIFYSLLLCPSLLILILFIAKRGFHIRSFKYLELLVLGLLLTMLPPILLGYINPRYFILPSNLILMLVFSQASKFMGADIEKFFALMCSRFFPLFLMLGVLTSAYGATKLHLTMSETYEQPKCVSFPIMVTGELGPEIAAKYDIFTIIEPDNWGNMPKLEKTLFFKKHGIKFVFNTLDSKCYATSIT